jgi:hypothetical protein
MRREVARRDVEHLAHTADVGMERDDVHDVVQPAAGRLEDRLKPVEGARRLCAHVARVERPAGRVGAQLARDEQEVSGAHGGRGGETFVPIEALGLDRGPRHRARRGASTPGVCKRSIIGI